MQGQITVNLESIEQSEQELIKLKNFLENRNAVIHFEISRGEMVDSLLELSKKLEETKTKLALFCENTAKALEKARTNFHHTDKTMADHITTLGVGDE